MNTRMKKNKLSIRPSIESIDLSASVNPQEVFQNQVLRPILKLQHEIIIFFVAHALLRRGNKYKQIEEAEQEKYIANLLSKDIALLNQLKGIVLGMMTIDEISSYKKDERDLNKRIISMLKKRILDSRDDIIRIVEEV